jgi:monofunctional biosynthetic peptidoglycan transglycosylase
MPLFFLQEFILHLSSIINTTMRILLKWLLRIVVSFVVASLLGVFVFRFLPIPFTWLMLIRKTEAIFDDKQDTELRYDWRSIDEFSQHIPLAIIASEDQLFPEHFGFDFKAIEKAVAQNAKRKKVKGASTISQQVAKNVFLWPGRTYIRKGFEVWFTLLIEVFWPKWRIIEVYMNVAETGRLTFGYEAAAQRYFRSTAARLSRDQAASITATLPSPLKMNPAKPSAYLLKRKQHIISQMQLLGGNSYLKRLD